MFNISEMYRLFNEYIYWRSVFVLHSVGDWNIKAINAFPSLILSRYHAIVRKWHQQAMMRGCVASVNRNAASGSV